MQLTNSFTIPVPAQVAWETLLDLERVAPCLPGATVDRFDGTVCDGRVKVKLGPINLQYRGEMIIKEQDDTAHRLTVHGTGKEMKGSGSANARIEAVLTEADGITTVTVETDLGLTGRPAQFGRGMIADVSNSLISTFAGNLAKLLAEDGAAPSVGDTTDDPASSPSATGTATTSPVSAPTAGVRAAEAEALDLSSLVSGRIKRQIAAGAALVLGLAAASMWLRRRRTRAHR